MNLLMSFIKYLNGEIIGDGADIHKMKYLQDENLAKYALHFLF